ncbi:MAG: NAD-dependent epimerase/dehydratase family protein [Rhodospirillales bacterium]|nr:NAD-dependent epimerase/dehydratase family protein [Rhodospirillales bacterium]
MKSPRSEFFDGCTVAVTGGAGLIGSFVAEQLVDAGARVVVVDDFSKGQRANLKGIADRIEVREGNLEDQAFAEEALGGVEMVFHLASRAFGVGYSSAHHLDMLEHNERINNNLFSAARRTRPARIQVVSSSCVYPDDGPDTVPELPLFTGEPEGVNLGYGWAKRFLEQKAVVFQAQTGIPVSIVRPFNIYGERYTWVGQYSQAIPMLVKRVMDGADPVVIWGSGNQRRNYLHATDCARAMVSVMASGFTEPVNIGTEDTVTMRELVGLICRLSRVSPQVVTDTTKPEGRFIKSADSRRLRTVVPDFHVAVGLEEGIVRMIGWYHASFGVGAAVGAAT